MSGFLLAVWLRSLILAAAGMLLLFGLRRRSASIRHAATVCVLAAVFALPFLGQTVASSKVADLPTETSVIVVPLVTSPALAYETASGEAAPATMGHSVPTIFGWLWLAGVAFGIFRLGRSLWELRRHVVAGEDTEVELPIGCRATVMTDTLATVPMTAWWKAHRIFLPADWRAWPEEHLETAIRHEAAHIGRLDWFTRMGCQLAGVIFWPNPLIWLLVRNAHALAEQAADDAALMSGIPAWRYAQDLLQIAKRAQAAAPIAAIPLAGKADVAKRIEMVLEQNRTRRAVTPGAIVAMAASLIALAIPMASWAAQSPQTPPVQPTKAGEASVYRVTQVKELKNGKEPVQFQISTRIYKASIELKTNAKRGPNSLVILTTNDKDSRITSLKDANMVSAPIVRTLAGMSATIRTSTTNAEGVEGKDELTLTPETPKGGRFVLNIGFVHTDPHGAPVAIKPVSVRVKAGETVVLMPEKSGRTGMILVLKPIILKPGE